MSNNNKTIKVLNPSGFQTKSRRAGKKETFSTRMLENTKAIMNNVVPTGLAGTMFEGKRTTGSGSGFVETAMLLLYVGLNITEVNETDIREALRADFIERVLDALTEDDVIQFCDNIHDVMEQLEQAARIKKTAKTMKVNIEESLERLKQLEAKLHHDASIFQGVDPSKIEKIDRFSLEELLKPVEIIEPLKVKIRED